MNRSSTTWIIVAVIAALLLCCLCLAGLGLVGGLGMFVARESTTGPVEEWEWNETQEPWQIPEIPGLPTLQFPTFEPEFPNQQVTPTPRAAGPRPTLDPGAEMTLRTLQEAVVPNSNLLELAERLGGKSGIPETLPAPAQPLEVGAQQEFFATNVDTNETFKVSATLRSVTDHLYFWIEDGVRYNENDLRALVEAFESQIYPTNREFFGSEWSPGVDNDPRLYVLFAGNLGGSLAGYFSSSDEYHPDAHEFSNAHEMFMLNSDNLTLDDPYTYGVLAHEFQHMIHWYRDRNEESWLNEGFSVLSELLNGYDIGGFDYAFAADPDLQLNDWPNDPNATTPHYGAGFLYLAYFLDRFGEDMTKALVAEQANGMVSIDTVLSEAGATDPETGQPLGADDVFADWVVTNFLQDENVADGRFHYGNYPSAPQVDITETISDCPVSGEVRSVSQYGADYIHIDCQGDYTLRFLGDTQVGVLPEDANSGKYAFWSNKGDESNMTLTQTFDFTSVSGPLELRFSTWFDLEEDYDYLYLLAQEDGGPWQILRTPGGTNRDISGNSYGWGYNGVTGGWVEETVDLSAYAGKRVALRFEYVTDAAVNGEGFLLDDVSIPAIGYTTDFEQDEGGWEAAGWVRIENILPQTFRVTLITYGDEVQVTPIELNADQTAEIPLQIGPGVEDAVLVVSGTTRFTRQPATYEFSVEP